MLALVLATIYQLPSTPTFLVSRNTWWCIRVSPYTDQEVVKPPSYTRKSSRPSTACLITKAPFVSSPRWAADQNFLQAIPCLWSVPKATVPSVTTARSMRSWPTIKTKTPLSVPASSDLLPRSCPVLGAPVIATGLRYKTVSGSSLISILSSHRSSVLLAAQLPFELCSSASALPAGPTAVIRLSCPRRQLGRLLKPWLPRAFARSSYQSTQAYSSCHPRPPNAPSQTR